MPNYVIPNVLHFVWFGNKITRCKETLIAWRSLHPNQVINLWTSTDIFSSENLKEIKKFSNQYGIKLRNIKQETNLDLYDLIMQEIDKGRYWSASDIARFSIINEEPGFYFDIGIVPKEQLPEKISCTQGFLLKVDVKHSVTQNGASIGYNIFCSAYKNHPYFKKIISLINANFEFLEADPIIEKNFYGTFSKELSQLYPELTMKQEVDYIFARIMTGRVAPTVLHQDYIGNDATNINLKFFNLSFNYQSLLDIPPGKDFNEDNLVFKQLKKHIDIQLLLNTAKKQDNPFTEKLSHISGLNFFSLRECYGPVHLLAPLTNKEHLEKTKTLKSELGGICIGLRKNKFFMFPDANSKKSKDKIESYLNRNSRFNIKNSFL